MSATPRYVVKKVGDQFLTERQQDGPSTACTAWALAGTYVTAKGFARRSFPGVALMLAGSLMLYRGFTGQNPLPASLRLASKSRNSRTGNPSQSPSHAHDATANSSQLPTDATDEALMESFPASDPPAHTTAR